jgi:hypothetical protein
MTEDEIREWKRRQQLPWPVHRLCIRWTAVDGSLLIADSRSVLLSRAKSCREACIRRVDVQNPQFAITDVAEAVQRANWRSHPRPRVGADKLMSERELCLAFKDVKRIDVIVVDVRLNREPGTKAAIDYPELG